MLELTWDLPNNVSLLEYDLLLFFFFSFLFFLSLEIMQFVKERQTREGARARENEGGARGGGQKHLLICTKWN